MKVAFLTRKSPYDKRSWSGAFYNMFSKLQSKHEVEWLKPEKRTLYAKFILSGLSVWYKLTSKKKLSIINKIYASSTDSFLNKHIIRGNYDMIFAAASPELIINLKTKLPIVYFLDATFKQLTESYPAYSNLPEWNFEQGMKVEIAALNRADHIIVSSQWAKRSIENDFKVSPSKVSIIGFGANIGKIPDTLAVYDLISKRFSTERSLNLLFVGKNWERKGGKLALDAFIVLNEMKVKTTLTIIGTIPPELPEKHQELLKVIPNLNINNKEEFIILYNKFEEADFFILPTRGDCTPIVFSEAAAFGLPVITTDVGGIKDVVKDGITGRVLPVDATGSEYAQSIIKIYSDKDTYIEMSRQSRKRYEDYLNWDTWANTTGDIMKNLINKSE